MLIVKHGFYWIGTLGGAVIPFATEECTRFLSGAVVGSFQTGRLRGFRSANGGGHSQKLDSE